MSDYTTQMNAARQGIITPEMEYIAIRENQMVDKIREAYKKERTHGSERASRIDCKRRGDYSL